MVFKIVGLGGGMMFFEPVAVVSPHEASDEVVVATPLSEAEMRLRRAAPDLAAVPEVTLVAYSVSGRSARAVRTSMNTGRPAEVDGGERFDGVTRWRYSARWQGRGAQQCVPDTVVATVAITVILPDLIEPEKLSRRDREAWDRYFKALATHEMNHARIALHGRQEMEKAMRAATGCEDMQAASSRVSSDISAASREYDRLTEHGKREGAVFP
jgi:predicted secreted Zn-dependent protease